MARRDDVRGPRRGRVPAGGRPDPTPTPPSGWVPPPCNLERTGAFRRVLSKPGSGPSWGLYRYVAFSAQVYLPDPQQNEIRIALPNNETAYIYTGGWGEQPGSTVDAGFQYDQLRPWERKWAAFLKRHGERDPAWYGRPGVGLAAGQYALLQFYVPADDLVAVRVEGRWTDGWTGRAESQGITMVSWRADGLYNRLKRVTSIGQRTVNYRSGSYVLGVHWYHTSLGRSLDARRPWDTSDTAEECNVPPDRVTVRRDSPGDEYVSVDLRSRL